MYVPTLLTSLHPKTLKTLIRKTSKLIRDIIRHTQNQSRYLNNYKKLLAMISLDAFSSLI